MIMQSLTTDFSSEIDDAIDDIIAKQIDPLVLELKEK